jgi:kynurenine 3-monooxygenase
MQANTQQKITIAGAGLAGALLATLLSQKGWQVDVFEKRPDPRVKGYEGGRSINLALAERGLYALRQAGLNDAVMQQAVMMRGRMVHAKNGDVQLQSYGKNDSEVIWSVHRGELNITLLNAAEAAGARITFNHRIEKIDFDKKEMHLIDDVQRTEILYSFNVLIGADGAGSAVRYALKEIGQVHERFESLGHSYKELEIPPAASGEFQIEVNALHIWPRGGYISAQ